MPYPLERCFGGGLRRTTSKSQWEKEVKAAERRLSARAQEEAMLSALRSARAERKTQNSPSTRPSLGYLCALAPQPTQPVTTPDPHNNRSKCALWDPRNSHTKSTLSIPIEDVAGIKRALEAEIREHGNYRPGPHPLQVRYERARERAVQRGERDPGDVGAIVKLSTPEQRLKYRIKKEWGNGDWTYEDGTWVQRGFAAPKKKAVNADADTGLDRGSGLRRSESWETVSSIVTVVYDAPALLRRNRSCTIDDRLLASVEITNPEDQNAEGDGVGNDEDADSVAVMSVGSPPDAAEAIAAYHERRANYFGHDAEAAVREAQTWHPKRQNAASGFGLGAAVLGR